MPPSKFGAGYTYGGNASTPAGQSPTPPTYPPAAAYPTPTYPDPVAYTSPDQSAPSGSATNSYAAGVPAASYLVPAPSYAMVGAAPASGATAITAGVLALLIGIYRGWQTYAYFSAASVLGRFSEFAHDVLAFTIIAGVVSAVGTIALVVGAVKLFNRSFAGRKLVALGCLIQIADVLLSWVILLGWLNQFSAFGGYEGESVASAVFSRHGAELVLPLALGVGIPLLTMILALSAATRRWCEAARLPNPYGPPARY